MEVRPGKAGLGSIRTSISLAAGRDVHGSTYGSQACEAADFPVKKQCKVHGDVYWYSAQKGHIRSLVFGVF